jgi:ABC-2 type transport system permease protein
MSKIGLIIKREYKTRVRKKSFIVMTLLGPLLFAGLMFGTVWATLADQKTYQILVSDPYGVITNYISETDHRVVPRFPDRFKDSENVIYAFTEKTIEPEKMQESLYNVMVEVDDATINDGKCQLYFSEYPSSQVKDKLEADLQESLERFRVLDSLQLDYEKYKRAKIKVSFAEVNLKNLGQKDYTQQKAMVGFGFAILIYFFIFLYGVQVMRGVIEEKTSRIVEVMVSSVKPFELMMGKVVGIGLVGLTQFLIWVVLSGLTGTLALNYFESQLAGGSAVVENGVVVMNGMSQAQLAQNLMNNEAINWLFQINWTLMISMFVFFFIGGYLLYASLFAAIGAAVDSDTDTQQFMLPITLPLVFSYIVAFLLIENPASSIGNFFSIFPLTSPITIMVKLAIGNGGNSGVHWLHLLGSMAALVLAFLFFIWLGGKIYRVGILSYGKRVGYKDIWRWIRQKN